MLLLEFLARPAGALLVLGLGIGGVCCELAGVGRILPGVLGAACVVLGLGSPAASTFDVPGEILVTVSLACLAFDAFFRARGLIAAVGAMLLFAGLRRIDPDLNWLFAAASALLFSFPITCLLTVGLSARRNKLGILKT